MAKHPVPKKKHSKSRRNTRRAHDALSAPTIVDCPECGSKKVPHAVCLQCGSYKGRQVVAISD